MNHSTSTPEKGIPDNQDGVTIANTVVSVTANRVNKPNGEFSHWKYVASCKDGSEIVLRAKSAHFYNWAHLSQYANTTSAKGIARNFSFGKTKPSGHLKTYEVLPNDPNEWQPEDSEVVRINDSLAIKQAEVAKLDRSEPLAAPVHNPIPAEVESSDPVVKTVEVEIQTMPERASSYEEAHESCAHYIEEHYGCDLVTASIIVDGVLPSLQPLSDGKYYPSQWQQMCQKLDDTMLEHDETFTQQEQPAKAAVNAVFLRQLDKQIDLVREGVTYYLPPSYGDAPRCDCLRTGTLLDCNDILNAYMADPACPDSIKPLIRKCANNTVHEEDHEDALYYAGELQIAIENLLEESETFTQQEQPAAQVNAELDLYAIELERGIAIKAAKSWEHARKIAEQESNFQELEIVDVRLADEEDIEWVRSMGGHIPRLPDQAVKTAEVEIQTMPPERASSYEEAHESCAHYIEENYGIDLVTASIIVDGALPSLQPLSDGNYYPSQWQQMCQKLDDTMNVRFGEMEYRGALIRFDLATKRATGCGWGVIIGDAILSYYLTLDAARDAIDGIMMMRGGE